MTYGLGIGLILKVPAENIFSTREVDQQSNQIRNFLNTNPTLAAEKIIEKYKKYGLDSPQNLLSNTPDDFYNEILLLGATPGRLKTEVIGYFIKRVEGINIVELTGNMNALVEIAQNNKLPIVILDSSNVNTNRLKQYKEWNQ